MPYLNTASLEEWSPEAPAERWCAVTVLERYDFDGASRVRVRIDEGPEAGREVSGLSPTNLRDWPIAGPVA